MRTRTDETARETLQNAIAYCDKLGPEVKNQNSKRLAFVRTIHNMYIITLPNSYANCFKKVHKKHMFVD